MINVAGFMQSPCEARVQMMCSCGEILFEGISADLNKLDKLKWDHLYSTMTPLKPDPSISLKKE